MTQILVNIILLIGILSLGLFYVGPAWKSFQQVRNEIEQLHETSAELDTLIENRDKLLRTVNTVSQSDLAKIEEALPRGQKSKELLTLLERLAIANGVTLKTVDVGTVRSAGDTTTGSTGQPRPTGSAEVSSQRPGPFKEFSFTMQIEAPYGVLKTFLNNLEKNLPIVDVVDLSFSPPKQNEVFDVLIKAKTYYQ